MFHHGKNAILNDTADIFRRQIGLFHQAKTDHPVSARRNPPPDTQAIQRSCATLPKPLKLRQTRDCLKHGSSKSLRELQKIEPAPFTLQEIEGKALVDVTAEGFWVDWSKC